MAIQELRTEIDAIDAEIISRFEKRMALCEEIALYKREHGLSIRDEQREAEKLRELSEMLPAGLRGYGASLYERIFRLSRLRQRLLNGENIMLVGMPGSGKTTVARALGEALGCGSGDSDELVERMSGERVERIFEQRGEDGFRKLETQALSELCSQSGIVIATGGGCVTREENRLLLKKSGTVVWLRREIEKLSIDGRPLSVCCGVETLYRERAPLYEALADCAVDNDSSVAEAVERIIETV